MFYLKLAIKSIFERRRQYKSLFAVCAVGVCLILCSLMITDGMIGSMNEKARQYYGGDVQLLGGESLDKSYEDAEKERQILYECLDGKNVIVMNRFNHDGSKDSYYFEGSSVRQRSIIGVDFENESKLFDKFTFIEGSYKKDGYEDTVLLAEPIAKKLGCHAGDSITLYSKTDDGYVNTIELVLTGIFQDASVFGMYTSYINYDSLMKVLNKGRVIDRISVYYLNGTPSKGELARLQKKLEQKLNMFPFGMLKEQFYDEFGKKTEPVYALISLESNVANLKMLVQALKLIVAAIVILLAVIISVGISSTYRVIVIKRSLESGTMRALGMKPVGVMRMFLSEAFVLLVSGCLTGFVFSAIIVKIASMFNLSFVSGFDLFLTGGALAPSMNAVKILAYIAVIIVTTLLSVLFTLRKLVRVSPVGAITATT